LNHRHLLPEEIDLLVDNEEGFGVAPLKAHIEQCDPCRREVEAERLVVAELEQLPHLAPSPLFAYKVMKHVQVFEPWHAAALGSLRRFVPRSRAARVLTGATAGVVMTTLSAAAILIAFRLDAALFVLNLFLARARGEALGAASHLAGALFGETALASLRGNGVATIAVAATIVFLTVVGTAVGLRAVASASRRRRS
jgi:hypothetical protein